MDKMHRAQILLEPEQHQELAEIARESGTSISEIVRRAVRRWLDERSEEGALRQRLEALEQVRSHRAEILRRRDGKALEIDLAEMIEQMREQRDDELLAGL